MALRSEFDSWSSTRSTRSVLLCAAATALALGMPAADAQRRPIQSAQQPVPAAPEIPRRPYDIEISKRATNAGPWAPGSQQSFDIHIRNVGATPVSFPANTLSVDDALPPALAFLGVAPPPPLGSFQCSGGPAVSCINTRTVTLTPGQAFTFRLNVRASDRAGRYRNCARVASRIPSDINPRNNNSCAEFVIGREQDPTVGDITIDKTIVGNDASWPVGTQKTFQLEFGATAAPGGTATWAPGEIGVTDAAHQNSQGTFTVDSVVTPHPGWQCSGSGDDQLPCTNVNPVTAPGGGGLSPLQVVATATGAGNAANCGRVAVSRPGGDTNAQNSQDCTEVRIVPGQTGSFDLSIEKVLLSDPSGINVGDTIAFELRPTLTVTGAPVQLALNSIDVTDAVTPASGLTIVQLSDLPSIWDCDESTMRCDFIPGSGSVPVGTHPLPPITVLATVNQTGSIRNCATVSYGPDVARPFDESCVTVTVVPDPPPPCCPPLVEADSRNDFFLTQEDRQNNTYLLQWDPLGWVTTAMNGYTSYQGNVEIRFTFYDNDPQGTMTPMQTQTITWGSGGWTPSGGFTSPTFSDGHLYHVGMELWHVAEDGTRTRLECPWEAPISKDLVPQLRVSGGSVVMPPAARRPAAAPGYRFVAPPRTIPAREWDRRNRRARR